VSPAPEPPPRVEVAIPTRTLVRILITVLAFGVLIAGLWQVRSVLTLFVVAAFLALALNPIVSVLERRLGGRRGIAAAVVILGVMVVAGLIVAALVTPVYNEMRSLATRAPLLVDDLRTWGPFADLDARYDFLSRTRDFIDEYADRLPAQASNLLGVATAVVTGLGKALTVLFMTLFLLLEIPRLTRSITELLRPGYADRSLEVFEQVNGTIARWTGGVLLIASIAGTTMGVTAWVLDVPYALALGLLVGMLALIPLIGATIGSAIAVLVALTQSVTAAVILLLFAVAYQLLENHVIQPVVMRRTVDVSPFIVLASVLVGASLLGIIGALLAIPVAGSVQVVLREILKARRVSVAAEREFLVHSRQATLDDVEPATETD
jgi:predicted PurR-regulated permease PerM